MKIFAIIKDTMIFILLQYFQLCFSLSQRFLLPLSEKVINYETDLNQIPVYFHS